VHTEQLTWNASEGWQPSAATRSDAQLALYFGSSDALLMGQRIDDEIQAVREVLPADVAKLGFYSYGEIAPHSVSGICELHNQTMTVTILSEVET
jgi:hypothetical protein